MVVPAANVAMVVSLPPLLLFDERYTSFQPLTFTAVAHGLKISTNSSDADADVPVISSFTTGWHAPAAPSGPPVPPSTAPPHGTSSATLAISQQRPPGTATSPVTPPSASACGNCHSTSFTLAPVTVMRPAAALVSACVTVIVPLCAK